MSLVACIASVRLEMLATQASQIKDSDPKHHSTMRVECIVFYVDPKSVGSLNFLGKERVRFPITDEHSSLAVFTKKFAEFAGVKAEAEKRGLGSCVELKFCRLEKGKDGSKAFAINTQPQWDEERPLLSGNTSSLQGRKLFTSY